MSNQKLIRHSKEGNFHYFEMEGKLNTYKVTVVKVPNTIEGNNWSGGIPNGFYIVTNESNSTNKGSRYSYGFTKHYFDGSNREYMPNRLGIPEEYFDDFVDCIARFVYPRI